MKRMLLTLTLLASQFVFAAEPETKLEAFLLSYPVLTTEMEDQAFQRMLVQMDADAEVYRYFFDGPEDDGGDMPEKDEWYAMKSELALGAQELVAEYLELPSGELRSLTLELMDRYLHEPENRLALQEVFSAFEALKFNDAYYNAIDMAHDWRPSFGTGFAVGGGITLAIMCLRRKSLCSRLKNQGDLIRRARSSARTRARARARNMNRKMSGREAVSVLRQSRGLSRGPKEPIVGSELVRETFYLQYMKYGLKLRTVELAYVVGAGGSMGALALTGQMTYNHFRDGNWEYAELNPAELELKYYGALAVLEYTCRAKAILTDQSATYETTRDFMLQAHRDLQMLGRMAGSLRVYDKTLLDFVTPLPETGQVRYNIVLADNENDYKEIEDTIACPGVENMGSTIYTSLAELEDLVKDLRDKALKLTPTQEVPAPATAEEAPSQDLSIEEPI